jgi:type II secretory pathway pseudopilin PulG
MQAGSQMLSRVLHIRAAGAPAHKSASAGAAFRSRIARGFSILELLIVVGIGVTVVAIAMPFFMQGFYNIRLKSAASNLSGLMQQARIQAARQNQTFTIRYTTTTPQQAYIDFNNSGSWNSSVTINGVQMPEPIITFTQSITMAAGAPSGAGAPPPYVLVGDSSGTTYDNATTLGYSSRGLPCAYTTSTGACPTPAPGYFVYYIQDARVGSTGWAGVVVTRSGRTRPIVWDGTTWN